MPCPHNSSSCLHDTARRGGARERVDLTTVWLFQYHCRWGQPRRGSGPAVQALGAGGFGGGYEEYTGSWGQVRLPFRPRLETSNLHLHESLSSCAVHAAVHATQAYDYQHL